MALSNFKRFEERDALFRNSKGKVKAAPELHGVPVADAHCHLGMLDDVPLALARCAVNGVRFLECITDPSDHGDDEKSAAEVYALLPSWLDEAAALLAEWGSESELPRVRMASGVHPHNAKDWGVARDELIELLDRKSVV